MNTSSIRRFSVLMLAVVPLFVTQGCMLATQQDILKLDDDVNQMRKNQADLITKMTDLGGNLETLNSQLESSQQRMTMLSQKLDDLQADLSRRLSVLTGQVTGTTSAGSSNPGDVYRLAYNDYQAGKFDLAVVGFRNFMSQYPKSDLAPQAQFQIGECEFGRKNYMDAAREYDKVSTFFPKSDVVPKALYKKGVAYQQAGKKDEAAAAFRHLIKQYPHNDLSKSAKDILKESQ
ncbi:MAG: tol-pal system protein YbgF [Elusimicrobiota bacterium]|jgi:tol-pal system protein YbgF